MRPRVLLVDDHGGFRVQAKKFLEGAGYHVVVEASNGKEALTAARDVRPDIVLLDVHLPDANGFDLVRALRERGAGHVVMISGRALGVFSRRLAGSLAAGFIYKPDLSEDSLKRLLESTSSNVGPALP